MTSESLQVSPEKIARYQDLAHQAEHNFNPGYSGDGMELEFLRALKLQVPHFEESPAVSSTTFAKATKNVPQSHATRQLAELMEHFPQKEATEEGIDGGKIELALTGTCAGLDTTVKFSPKVASFGIRKPAAEPVDVAERMVDHALGYISGWRSLVAKVRDPQSYGGIEDTFLDMLATAKILIDTPVLGIEQNEQAVIIARFEKDCQVLGMDEPEAAFINIGSILYPATDAMWKTGAGVSYSMNYYHMSGVVGFRYSSSVSLEPLVEYLKRVLVTDWTTSDGRVVERASIYAIRDNMLKTGNEDEIGRLFRKLELVGADQEALKNKMVLRSLYATGGRDAALSYYFRRKYGERFVASDGQYELRMSNFREIARALEDYGRAVGVPIDLDLRERRLESSGANLLEDIGFLKNASEVILDETQEIDFHSEIRKTLRGENNVPIMFVGRSGAGKTTLAAAFGEMIMAQREQGYEDMVLYTPKRKGGEGVMTAQEVENAILEFAIDAIYNSGDSKFRYLVIDDLHHIGLDPNQWKRIHQILNLVNPYLKENPNAKIAITTEESPNTVALQAAQRIKKFNANTLYAQDKSAAQVGKHMKLALQRKCKIPDDRATAVTKLIMGIAKEEVDKRGGAVPYNAVTFGFVVRDVGDNIAEETSSARIEAYIRDKMSTRFNEIETEAAAKRRDEVAIALGAFQEQLASMSATSEADHNALIQLQETVADLRSRGESTEQALQQAQQQLTVRDEEMQATITNLLKALEEERAARIALEERVGKGGEALPSASAEEQSAPTALSQTPQVSETGAPRGNLVIPARGRRRK